MEAKELIDKVVEGLDPFELLKEFGDYNPLSQTDWKTVALKCKQAVDATTKLFKACAKGNAFDAALYSGMAIQALARTIIQAWGPEATDVVRALDQAQTATTKLRRG